MSAASIFLYLFACVLLGTYITKNRKGACRYLIQLVKISLSDVLNKCNFYLKVETISKENNYDDNFLNHIF